MLTVTFSEGTIVDLENNVLSIIRSYEQQKLWSKEAGGVLIGKELKDTDHYIITAASTPTRHDKRSRFSFTRSMESAQPLIDRKWEESGGIENYIGEWHTHPESKPTPSGIDQALIRQVVSDNSSPFPKVFLVIGGLNGSLYLGVAETLGSGDISISRQIEVDYEYIRNKG